MKRVVSFVLAFMLVMMVALPVFAQSDFPHGDIYGASYPYLVNRNDGYMRLTDTWRYSKDGHPDIFAQYYDKDLNFIKNEKIPRELPEFGGFYTDGQNYYILSYLENEKENNNIEVLRITKYDTNWNRLSSAGLNNIGMTELRYYPRFAQVGNILYVRGGMHMYKSSDGVNHEASFMLALNMDTMKFVNSQKISAGYLSHSVDRSLTSRNGRLIDAELGDGYPRALLVREYLPETDGSCKTPIYSKTLMTPVGNRSTIDLRTWLSETQATDDYILLSGKMIHQDSEDNITKNFFVYSINRETQEFTVHWFTNMPEGEKSIRNCHLVPIGNDQFMAIWQVMGEKKVYFQKIDEHASPIGEEGNVEGGLGMETPVVDGDNIIWIDSGSGIVTSYRLNINNMTCASKVTISMEKSSE